MNKISGERVAGTSSLHMQSLLRSELKIIPREDSVYFNYATMEWSDTDTPGYSLGQWDGLVQELQEDLVRMCHSARFREIGMCSMGPWVRLSTHF